jgi:hypothetical protein
MSHKDPQAANIARTFAEAINIMDRSELLVRDIIERELADVAGISGQKVSDVMLAADTVSKKINAVREVAIKKAFQHIQANLPDDEWMQDAPQLEGIDDVNIS